MDLHNASREAFGTPELAEELGKFTGNVGVLYPASADAMWESAAVMYSDAPHLWQSFVNGWNRGVSLTLHARS